MTLPDEEQQLNKKLTIQLEEMKKTLELKEKEIQERVDNLYQQRVNEFFLNAHKVNHMSTSIQCNIETADREIHVQKGIIIFIMSYFDHELCIKLFS